MENIKVRDVKKVLRLSGWELVMVDGYRFYYSHPAVSGYFTICGRGNDIVSPATLRVMERQVGQSFGYVFA